MDKPWVLRSALAHVKKAALQQPLGSRDKRSALYLPHESFKPVILLNTGLAALWSLRSATK